MPRDDHGVADSAYGRAALRRGCEAVRTAPFGWQDRTINAARKLQRLRARIENRCGEEGQR